MKRLYISPLNPQTLDIILPGPLLEKASHTSLHTIQTFPENNYGYVELPEMEAGKLKRKLQGSTLRGSKMKVEEARPKKRRDGTPTRAEEQADQEKLDRKARKNRAREEGVIQGHELQNRKVKRGWTDSSKGTKPSKRHREKAERKSTSKLTSTTGNAECLFKTSLPPNAANSGSLEGNKEKKRKRASSKLDVVIREFSNATKYQTFLRDESDARDQSSATRYVEGKGWVDGNGNIVEPESKRRKSKTDPDGKGETLKNEATTTMRTRSRRSSRLGAPSVKVTSPLKAYVPSVITDETSSSGTSSSYSENDSASTPKSPPSEKAQRSRQKKFSRGLRTGGEKGVELGGVERLSITRSSATPPPSQDLPPTSVPPVNEVHPLEALFKRPNTAASHTPKKPNLEVSTSFNFFDSEVDGGENQGLLVPQTPFTQQDIRQRRQRSAAPTPDTAAPGKTFGSIWEETSDISDGEEDDDDGLGPLAGPNTQNQSATPEIKEEKLESDFAKWFWEHRGENNRAWKRRRREATKEKRQKENKERRG